MVRIGFWFDAPVEYSGGLNYVRNLLYAVSLVNDGSVKPYVFFASDIPASVEAEFSPYATVVRTKVLQRGTSPWFIHRVLERVFGSLLLATRVLESHGISILSHVWFVYPGSHPFRIISWIPDFQYLHLPELFPTNPAHETRQNQKIIEQADVIVLSSHNAFGDFKKIAPAGTESRAKVLQFVSQPRNTRSYDLTREDIEQRYGFHGRFFLLPNQFWAHKNHIVVLKAVNVLKQRGLSVLVLCTGNATDYRYRGSKYIDSIYNYLETNGLQEEVRILGQIPYPDVLFMMRNAVAVLNPSRFEGWSSSVEEAKSIGKRVILSRIDVHVEQNPPNAQYFDLDDSAGLADILASAWLTPEDGMHDHAESLARAALHQRTLEYGRAYLEIVKDVAHRVGAST